MKIKYALTVFTVFLSSVVFGQSSKKLIPDFIVMQNEGSIGFISTGIGYSVLDSKARLSFHYGFVPKQLGGVTNIISTKLYFKTATITVWNRIRMNPFDVGVMASYNFGNNVNRDPAEAATLRGYYWWGTAFRAHIGLESSVTYEFPKNYAFKALTGYFEINTNELYFLTFAKNMDKVKLGDVVKIGSGFRIFF